MKEQEIKTEYEKQTGSVIIETFNERGIDPNQIPGVLVNDHGPFTWGDSPEEAVHNSVVLEQVAEMTYHTIKLNSQGVRMCQNILDKHYLSTHEKVSSYVH